MNNEKIQKAILRVNEVLNALLDPEKGCPWDKEQNPQSLAEYLIEECFECVSAIREEKALDVADEMGDLLFLLFFIAHKYEEKKEFDFADAFNNAADKMIRRHPHVFAEAKFKTKEEVMQSWLEIKKQEACHKNEKKEKGLYSSLVKSLPPLTKAHKIHTKAAQVGFTWETDEEVEQQIEAEWLELFDALQEKNQEKIEHEIGDIVFSLSELSRRKGIKLSDAIEKANYRFLKRFNAMEQLAKSKGLNFEELSLDEKDNLWNEIKKGCV